MKTIELFVKGEPVGKGRPRFRIFGGHISTYTPAKTKHAEMDIKEQIQEQYKDAPITRPISISVLFFMPIPKSLSKKKQVALIGELYTKKPDIDNLIKTYLDAMNGIIYEDDKQIYAIFAKKIYSSEPKVVINISY